MKYQVVIEEQVYTVEIIDLHERPIRALVDGEVFEIWPAGANPPALGRENQPARPVTAPDSVTAVRNPGARKNGDGDPDCIKAPIPGVILSLAVRPGDEVHKGQELCVLEAMKMKNLIRSPRDGVIAAVYVAPGQNVAHSEKMIDFEPCELAGKESR